jgi:hypothetical protein
MIYLLKKAKGLQAFIKQIQIFYIFAVGFYNKLWLQNQKIIIRKYLSE